MSSSYLSESAAEERLLALRERIADEVAYTECGSAAYWPSTSDYHRLPYGERCAVVAVVRRRNSTRVAVDPPLSPPTPPR